MSPGGLAAERCEAPVDGPSYPRSRRRVEAGGEPACDLPGERGVSRLVASDPPHRPCELLVARARRLMRGDQSTKRLPNAPFDRVVRGEVRRGKRRAATIEDDTDGLCSAAARETPDRAGVPPHLSSNHSALRLPNERGGCLHRFEVQGESPKRVDRRALQARHLGEHDADGIPAPFGDGTREPARSPADSRGTPAEPCCALERERRRTRDRRSVGSETLGHRADARQRGRLVAERPALLDCQVAPVRRRAGRDAAGQTLKEIATAAVRASLFVLRVTRRIREAVRVQGIERRRAVFRRGVYGNRPIWTSARVAGARRGTSVERRRRIDDARFGRVWLRARIGRVDAFVARARSR